MFIDAVLIITREGENTLSVSRQMDKYIVVCSFNGKPRSDGNKSTRFAWLSHGLINEYCEKQQ